MSSGFIHCLIQWYRTNKEKYFFRLNRNPYRVWISEVTLHQTRIQAGLLPLKKFLRRFPDVKRLALAKEEDVLLAFQGLGYYSRARNLHKGANYIINNYSGKLPSDVESLLKIPSIGPYTAGMIASICFNQYQPVIDANIARVLSRLLLVDIFSKPAASNKTIGDFLVKIFAKLKSLNLQAGPGDLNEALMELGQKICKKSSPLCQDNCPLINYCKAFQSKKVDLYPGARKKIDKKAVSWFMLIITDSQENVIIQKWDEFYFLKNQIGFPSILEFSQKGTLNASWQWSSLEIHKWKALKKNIKQLPAFRHYITNHSIDITPCQVKYDDARKIFPNLFLIKDNPFLKGKSLKCKEDLKAGCGFYRLPCLKNKFISSALLKVLGLMERPPKSPARGATPERGLED